MGYTLPCMVIVITTKVIYHTKKVFNNYITEIKITKVPKSDKFPEGIRYALVLIRNGKRILGYDNEASKGHHKHIYEKEFKYEFTNIYDLIKKFRKEVGEMENGNKNKGN